VGQLRVFQEKQPLIQAFLREFGTESVVVLFMFGYSNKLSEDYEILCGLRALRIVPFVQQFLPMSGIPTRIPEDCLDMDFQHIAAIRFRSNGQNGEKFLRFVNKLFFGKHGKYYLPLLETIYLYNNKMGINKYLRRPDLLVREMPRGTRA